jgi:hypothetical protein
MNENQEDRIQRALNEAKKRELEEKYGAHFGEGESKLPPELEAEWLSHIEEFERQYQNADRVTVRAFVGNPDLKPVAEIPPDQVQSEVENLLEILESNSITVHFDRKITAEETYRFLSEELMNQEIDNIRIEGMSHNFIYSEFHPEDE